MEEKGDELTLRDSIEIKTTPEKILIGLSILSKILKAKVAKPREVGINTLSEYDLKNAEDFAKSLEEGDE